MPSSKLRLIAMKGVPGSGKSRLAREIGRITGWRVIDKDAIMDALHGESSDAGRRAYTITLHRVEETLQKGESVIYDSPLTFASLCEEISAIAERTEAEPAIVECRCSDRRELRRRIEGREEQGLSGHRIVDWSGFVAWDERTSSLRDYPLSIPHLIVETNSPFPETVISVLQWLRT